jgi:hypothetical protein
MARIGLLLSFGLNRVEELILQTSLWKLERQYGHQWTSQRCLLNQATARETEHTEKVNMIGYWFDVQIYNICNICLLMAKYESGDDSSYGCPRSSAF